MALITGSGGNDTLNGTSGPDQILGLAGDDLIRPGDGIDVIDGGFGNDTVSYANSGAIIANLFLGVGNGGFAQGDTYVSIENLVGSAFGDQLIGDSLDNKLSGGGGADVLTGNAGNDVLDGGTGIDSMIGGSGNDSYYVDNAADQVVEAAGDGTDIVRSSVSYALQAGQEIEFLTTANSAGAAAINLTGNAFANTIYGNAGANVIDGGTGADTLAGLGGNDNYYVDNAADHVFEAAGGGTDIVRASVSYALQAGQEVEYLTTTDNPGTGAINLTGNNLANTIYGNAGANMLNGGLGADTLVGFAGHDTFVFNTTLGPSNIDHVYDFAPSTVTDHDTIQLAHAVFAALPTGALAASAFLDLASGPETASSRILYNHTTGALSYDADGTGGSAAVQFATIDNHAALTHSDFFVS